MAFITKAKAKDFCAVLKDTSRPRPRTNIPEYNAIVPNQIHQYAMYNKGTGKSESMQYIDESENSRSNSYSS